MNLKISERIAERTIEKYKNQGLWTRLYCRLRIYFYPVSFYDSHIAEHSVVADIGCGQGILTVYLALARPNIRIIGFEPNEKRYNCGKKILQLPTNCSFIKGGWADVPGNFDTIIVVEVLHHLPLCDHELFFRKIEASLKKGGELLLSEVDPSTKSRWKYWFSYFADVILYPFSEKCRFRTRKQITSFAKDAGLVLSEEPVKYIGSGITYVFKKI